MGNAKSIENLEVSAPSHPGQWTIQAQLSYCTLLQNNDTKYLAEEYSVPRDPRISTLKNFEIYDYRRKQNHNLVEVYQAEQESSTYLCQGRDYYKVKTQRIPFRLSQFGAISYPQGFFVLLNSLIGYKTIYEFNGPSIIDDEMIGFTQQGKVKVWLSSNFAKNTPDSQVTIQQKDGKFNEKSMVTQIFDVIKEHLPNQQYPEDFLNFYQQTSPHTFTETLQFIQDYLKYARIVLPASVNFKAEQSKITSLSVMPGQSKRGQSTLAKNQGRVNQPLLPCGFMHDSSNKFPQLGVPGSQITSQISKKTQAQHFSQLTPQTTSVNVQKQLALRRHHSALQEVVGSLPSISADSHSNHPVASDRGVENTFTFKQLKPSRHETPNLTPNLTPTKTRPSNFPVNFAQPPLQQYIPLQTLPSQPYQRFGSTPKTSLHNSRSVQKCPQRTFFQKNNYYVNQPENYPQRVEQIITPQLDRQIRVSNAYYSPDQKVTSVYISRDKSPSIIDSINPAVMRNRVQNIINRNSVVNNRSPIKVIPVQVQSTITQPHSELVGQPLFTFMPKVQSTITERVVQHPLIEQRDSKVVYLSPPKNTNFNQNSDYKLECTTHVDAVRPEIRKLMATLPKSSQPPVTLAPPPVVNIPSTIFEKIQYKTQIQPFQNNTSSILSTPKYDISEMKEIEVKNYLIGHSHISPIKSFDNKYLNYTNSNTNSNTVSTVKEPAAYLYNQNSFKNHTFEEKNTNIVVPEFTSGLVQENPFEVTISEGPINMEIHSFSNNEQAVKSTAQIRRATPFVYDEEIMKKELMNESSMAELTLKMGTYKNLGMQEIEDDLNISQLQTLVEKNFRSVQSNILHEMEESFTEPSKEPSVPTYEQLRQALLSTAKSYEFDSF